MSAVETVEFTVLQGIESKSADFISTTLPVNQCKSVTIHAITSLSISLDAKIYVEGSIDNESWSPIKGLYANITADDTIMFSLTDLSSIGYLRVKVKIYSGSSVWYIIGRSV